MPRRRRAAYSGLQLAGLGLGLSGGTATANPEVPASGAITSLVPSLGGAANVAGTVNAFGAISTTVPSLSGTATSGYAEGELIGMLAWTGPNI